MRTEIIHADARAIDRAAGLLRAGALVAFPTETVYGLGADAASDDAVAAIYAAKERPTHNPLIVHYAEPAAIDGDAEWSPSAETLARRFWPGPLTLVLRRRARSRLSPLIGAGIDTVATRVPAHPVARALLSATGIPLAAPSANRSGRLSPTTAAHVLAALETRIALVLDGGPCAVGVESTVVDLSEAGPARLLRPGGIPRAAIEAEIGALAGPGSAPARGPGMLAAHYAPARPLRLAARAVGADEALLAFGPDPLKGAAESRNLSPAGDLAEAAANLYAMLHALDRPGIAAIAVMAIPGHGLGAAINDRLRRAALASASADDAA